MEHQDSLSRQLRDETDATMQIDGAALTHTGVLSPKTNHENEISDGVVKINSECASKNLTNSHSVNLQELGLDSTHARKGKRVKKLAKHPPNHALSGDHFVSEE